MCSASKPSVPDPVVETAPALAASKSANAASSPSGGGDMAARSRAAASSTTKTTALGSTGPVNTQRKSLLGG